MKGKTRSAPNWVASRTNFVEEKYNLLEDYVVNQTPEDIIQVRVQQLGIAKVSSSITQT